MLTLTPFGLSMAKDRLSGKLVVILHADVAGSTKLVQLDKELAHERIQETFHRFSTIINKYQGHVLELRGDALLAEFEQASDAVTAALSFQSDQTNYLAQITDELLPMVRVGISVGEIVIADGTVTGAGVVQAQRIEQLANPGGVCVTAALQEALSNRMPFDLENLGEQGLKGFEYPVRVYRVGLSPGESIPLPRGNGRHHSISILPKLTAAVVAIALVVAGGTAYWFNSQVQPEEVVPIESTALPATNKPSIAVLPFTNMSSDAEQDYFVDGMTEDLITDISKISGLDVIARHSTFSYKGLNPDVREVGQILGASHVIEGSVRKVGNTIRITIQLINALDGKHVWAERYDRELRDVFAIQDEVIGEIITALSLKLTPEEEKHVARRGTENLPAYDLYMRGRQQESFFNKEGNIEAQHFFEQAVALDPDYAEAWAHLGQIHTLNGQFGWVDDIVAAHNRALELVEKSIQLDPDIPFSRFSYSRILARNSIGQLDRAIEEARKAIQLDPNYADARAYLGQLFIYTGQAEKAIEPIQEAMRINRNFPFWYQYSYGFALYFLRDFDAAAENIEKAVERNSNVIFMQTAFVASLAMAGRQEDAEWQVEELDGLGFSRSLDEYVSNHTVQDPHYRALLREGLARAGLQ
jgi:TolB-like protein/class 3 adenylate cyclase/Flp pilus assembly protein TadD